MKPNDRFLNDDTVTEFTMTSEVLTDPNHPVHLIHFNDLTSFEILLGIKIFSSNFNIFFSANQF